MALLALATFSNFLDGAEPTSGYLGEVGGPWARNPQYSAGYAYVSKAGRLYPVSGTSVYYPPQINCTNVAVSSDLVIIAAPSSSVGITARAQATAQTHYRLFYLNGTWYVQSNVANAASTIASFAATAAVGHVYRLVLSCIGASGSATLAWQVWDITSGNPALVWGSSATDTAAVPAGGQGGTFNASGTSETTGAHHDNICIADAQSVLLELSPRVMMSPVGLQTIAIMGLGSAFSTNTPMFSLSGPGAAGSTLAGMTVVSATLCTATFTPGTAEGVVQITDSRTGAIGYGYVAVPSLVPATSRLFPGLSLNLPIINHSYGNWTAYPPAIAGADGGTGVTFGAFTQQNGMAGYLAVDTHGASPGNITVSDSVSGASGVLPVMAPPSVVPGATATMPATDGAFLSAATGSNGGAWTTWFPGAGQRLIAESAATSGLAEPTVYLPGNLTAQAIYVDGGGSLDQSISVDLFTLSASDTNLPAAMVHCRPDANACYYGRYNYNGGSPLLELKQVLAGNTTTMTGTLTGTVPVLAVGTTYRLTTGFAGNSGAEGTVSVSISSVTGSVGTRAPVVTNLATLTATPGVNNVDAPGYAGIGFIGQAQATTTTGYRLGNVTIAGGVRAMDWVRNGQTCNGAVIQTTYSGGFIQYPSIAFSPNYLHLTYEGRLAQSGNNVPCDQVYFRIPLGSPAAIGWPMAATLLTNDGTGGTPSKINCYPGSGITAYYAAMCWVPGVGTGPLGRLFLALFRYPNGGNEGTAVIGNTPGLATSYTFMAWSDDEGATWSSLVDITSQTKAATWGFTASGSGSLIARPGGGLLFGIGAMGGSSSSTFFGTFLYGTRNYDGTGWSQLGQIAAGSDTSASGGEVSLCVAPDGSTLLAWTRPYSGVAPATFTLLRSTNGGANWTRFTPASFPLSLINVTCGLATWKGALAFAGPDATNRYNIIITYSVDGGNTWSSINLPAGNLPGGTTLWRGNGGNMQALAGPDGNLYVASDFGPGTSEGLFQVAPSWAALPVATVVSRRTSGDRAGTRGAA